MSCKGFFLLDCAACFTDFSVFISKTLKVLIMEVNSTMFFPIMTGCHGNAIEMNFGILSHTIGDRCREASNAERPAATCQTLTLHYPIISLPPDRRKSLLSLLHKVSKPLFWNTLCCRWPIHYPIIRIFCADLFKPWPVHSCGDSEGSVACDPSRAAVQSISGWHCADFVGGSDLTTHVMMIVRRMLEKWEVIDWKWGWWKEHVKWSITSLISAQPSP